ncbi:MAG: DUF1566 domain-containing protein [Epsilonproteobacteria bacterium]|nr:DUF1566 domain-containing protein [Campylobacterota bacterium]
MIKKLFIAQCLLIVTFIGCSSDNVELKSISGPLQIDLNGEKLILEQKLHKKLDVGEYKVKITQPYDERFERYGVQTFQIGKDSHLTLIMETTAVIDKTTHLMWQDSRDNAELMRPAKKSMRTKTKESANEYCENLNHLGYNNWRLPRWSEMRTITNQNNSYKIVQAFNYSKDGVYNTKMETNKLPVYNFTGQQSFSWSGHEGEYYVRCVRDL